ncbi:expressed unknown protein [Seminavis robusta]|uniref:Uncharacterized protein n=1 Tax=Seminavis robusta TaxID=568900 RepID=A0A9N8HKF3_9STRA|nr:expressed unknown protein [Seminavis robusta]|eukprot:Sro940_g222510.1 n/a (393) ;mRNA; r:2376-3757
MKLLFSLICIFAFAIGQCQSDFEFGRATLDVEEDELDVEKALRELMVHSNMFMSMSLSFSFDYDGTDDSITGSNDEGPGGSNGDKPSGSGTPSAPSVASPTTPSSPTPSSSASPASSPASVPTLSSPVPSVTLNPASSPTVLSVPTASPNTNASATPTSGVVLPSCFDFQATTLTSDLNIETTKDSIAFTVLENALDSALREVLPFCEELGNNGRRRRLEDLMGSGSDYYIGNVDLDEASDQATCTPEHAGRNCFVGRLTLRLFGTITDEIIAHVLEVVKGLLETDVGEALGAENGFIDNVNTDNTETDANGGDTSQGTRDGRSQKISNAGRKVLISMLCLVVAAFAGFMVFRRFRPRNARLPDDEDEDESDGSHQRTTAITVDHHDRMYAA